MRWTLIIRTPSEHYWYTSKGFFSAPESRSAVSGTTGRSLHIKRPRKFPELFSRGVDFGRANFFHSLRRRTDLRC